MSDREIGVEISFGFPPTGDMQADISKLAQTREVSRSAIRDLKRQIEDQRTEQKKLRALVDNPTDEDGITYNPEACANGADRCDKHVAMFEALIKKEQAKVDQATYMIGEIEGRIQLQEHGIQQG
jgi:hypothetical protein